MFPIDSYHKIFSLRAQSYDKAMQTWPNARDEEFNRLIDLAQIGPEHTILDIPSGGGYLARYLPTDAHLIHLEVSEVFAKLGLKVSKHPFVLCDQNYFPIADKSIDRLVCLAGLHHVENKKSCFKEIGRILKPKGIATIADAAEDSFVAEFLDEFVNKFNPMGHKGLYLNSETTSDLKACGLTIMHRESSDYVWTFPSVEDMIQYCRLLFGMTNGKDEDIKEGIEHYLGIGQNKNGVYMNWQLEFILAQNKD